MKETLEALQVPDHCYVVVRKIKSALYRPSQATLDEDYTYQHKGTYKRSYSMPKQQTDVEGSPPAPGNRAPTDDLLHNRNRWAF